MKVRYIAGVSALLTIVIFTWKSFQGPFAEMAVDGVSHPTIKTEDVNSPSQSTQMSHHSAFVAIIVFFILCLVWHMVSFFVWKSQGGQLLSLWKFMVAWKNEMPTRISQCREYRKVAYSDDEESHTGSPMPNIPRTQISVRFATTQYIHWLFQPICIIWSKYFVKRTQKVRPRGLQNLGNTCYFNSVMQTLASTYILQTSIHENRYSGEFNRRFERFCKWANNRRVGSKSSWSLWNLLCATIEQFVEIREIHRLFSNRARRFSDNGQHDSHECLRHVLDELRKDERDFQKNSLSLSYDERKSLTVVDKVFGGHFITVYICKDCGSPYHLFEPFLDISLPICLGSINSDQMEREYAGARNPQMNLQEYAHATSMIMNRLSKSTLGERQFPKSYSINDCLWYFTRIEHIQDEYLCNYCYSKHDDNVDIAERLTSATKQTLVFNPPAVLTIHLKRFELKLGRSEKRSDRIRYEELLDIAPYCSEFCLRNDPPEQNLWYSLYGIVVHSGSLEFGHYIAYIKVRSDEPDIKRFLQEEYFDRDKTKDELIEMIKKIRIKNVRRLGSQWDAKANEGIWFCMNDNWVSEVTVDEVLNQEAYLLLYERI